MSDIEHPLRTIKTYHEAMKIATYPDHKVGEPYSPDESNCIDEQLSRVFIANRKAGRTRTFSRRSNVVALSLILVSGRNKQNVVEPTRERRWNRSG